MLTDTKLWIYITNRFTIVRLLQNALFIWLKYLDKVDKDQNHVHYTTNTQNGINTETRH